jgi:hypothetical protein
MLHAPFSMIPRLMARSLLITQIMGAKMRQEEVMVGYLWCFAIFLPVFGIYVLAPLRFFFCRMWLLP